METGQKSLTQWFQEVVQPQLHTLAKYISPEANLADFEAKAFFKTFLADLELVGLDNQTVVNCAERIVDGIQTLKEADLQWDDPDLREVAMVALLKNRFDRSLFKGYWASYLPLVKKHKDIKDESLVNAYKVKLHIQALVNYLSKADLQETQLPQAA